VFAADGIGLGERTRPARGDQADAGHGGAVLQQLR
jgi:hypothetical protein